MHHCGNSSFNRFLSFPGTSEPAGPPVEELLHLVVRRDLLEWPARLRLTTRGFLLHGGGS